MDCRVVLTVCLNSNVHLGFAGVRDGVAAELDLGATRDGVLAFPLHEGMRLEHSSPVAHTISTRAW